MHNNIKITIIYQSDPLGVKAGGIDTFIKGFIKYAPDEFDINYIGVTFDNQKRPPREWIKARLGKKEFSFYPLMYENLQDKKKKIPLSLRFAYASCFETLKLDQSILFFHKIDPAIAYLKYRSPKITVIHYDVEKQLKGRGSEVLWRKFPFLYRKYEKYIFKRLNFIYCVNSKTCSYYRDRYPYFSSRFSFVPTWADIEMFKPSNMSKKKLKSVISEKWKVPIRAKWLLFVGRLQKQKAPMRLVETYLEYLVGNNDDAQLIIIGEGNLKEALINNVNQKGIKNKISFLNTLRQEDIVLFFQASDVFLLTSNYESMPMSVLEALGCGLPVVTTKVGEVERVVKNGYSGEVVNSFKPNDIAKNLSKVLNNPEQYSKENCVKTIFDYTPQKVLEPVYKKFSKIYHENI